VLLGSGNGSFVPADLFVPAIPVHLVEAVLVDVRSAPIFTPVFPTLALPASIPFVALTNTTTSGSGQVASESSGGQELSTDPLPPWLISQPEQILPTERDIVKGMDIAGSLPTWSQPQANLVPQPQDTLTAIG